MADATPLHAHSQYCKRAKRRVSLRARLFALLSALLVSLTGCVPAPITAHGDTTPTCFGGTLAPSPAGTDTRDARGAPSRSGLVVIAATATSAEPEPALTDKVVAELIELGEQRDDACAVLVTGPYDLTITTMPITPFRGNGEPEHGPHRAEAIRANVERIRQAVADVRATHAGLDPLRLLHELSTRYPAGTLYLVTSGVSTADPLDLRELRWGADATQVAASLRQTDALPDLVGWRVVLIGIGDAAGTKPALTASLRQRLTRFWTTLCRATGAECRTSSRRSPGPGPRSSNEVPVVPLPRPVRTSGQRVRIPVAVLFTLDSVEISADAEPVLAELAERARRELVRITGRTDASTGSEEHNDRLSLSRAVAVAEQLLARGVPRDHLLGVHGAGSRGFSAAEEARHPRLVDEHRNVTVDFEGPPPSAAPSRAVASTAPVPIEIP